MKLGTGWHNIELCGAVGSTSTWDLYRDGVKIVNAWTADTGTTAVGRLQLGDTGAKTWTINYDHVLVDLQPGEGSTGPDTTPPTTPGAPTGTSQTKDSINVTWSGSFDDSLPITYRIYRDGNPTSIGQTTGTTFTDTGLTQGSIHTYTVDAVDAVNNENAMSPVSAPIQVASLIFADDFSRATSPVDQRDQAHDRRHTGLTGGAECPWEPRRPERVREQGLRDLVPVRVRQRERERDLVRWQLDRPVPAADRHERR